MRGTERSENGAEDREFVLEGGGHSDDACCRCSSQHQELRFSDGALGLGIAIFNITISLDSGAYIYTIIHIAQEIETLTILH